MLRTARFIAAALILAGGLIHLRRYHQGYRYVPMIGVLFALNGALSILSAAVILFTVNRAIIAGATALSAGSLTAILLSHVGPGFLGYMERGWTNSAREVIAVEAGALIALGLIARSRSTKVAC